MTRYYMIVNKEDSGILMTGTKGTDDCKLFYTSFTEAETELKHFCELFEDVSYEDMLIISVEAPRVHKINPSFNYEGEPV